MGSVNVDCLLDSATPSGLESFYATVVESLVIFLGFEQDSITGS